MYAKLKNIVLRKTRSKFQNAFKVKAPIAGQYPIAGQSQEFFSKLEIYESLIAILVYRIQTSIRTL